MRLEDKPKRASISMPTTPIFLESKQHTLTLHNRAWEKSAKGDYQSKNNNYYYSLGLIECEEKFFLLKGAEINGYFKVESPPRRLARKEPCWVVSGPGSGGERRKSKA